MTTIVYDHVPDLEPVPEPAEQEASCADGSDTEALLVPGLRRDRPVDSIAIYCVFYLLGMGTLLPWNFFITADSYWMYKFRNTTDNSSDSDSQTDLQINFFGYLSVASMVPNTIFLTLNAVFGHKMHPQPKLISSLALVIVFFVITTILVPLETDSWQDGFFAATMVMVVILNMGSAIFQGGLFGVAAQFPDRYLSAVISGQALGAVFACVARVVSIAVSGQDDDKAAVTSALVYFILADITLAISMGSYIWMNRMGFYQFYMAMASNSAGGSDEKAPTISVWKIFLKVKWYALSVCLVFLVTLGVFPTITAKIEPVSDSKSTWNTSYFVPVCCFLLFNVTDYIGRICGGYTIWPKRDQSYIVLFFAVLRVAFVPLFLFSNVLPDDRSFDVVFDSDVYYIVFMVLFGLSNGYISTLCMIYGPGLVEPAEQNTASSMMAAFLGLGLCSGALLSNAIIKVL